MWSYHRNSEEKQTMERIWAARVCFQIWDVSRTHTYSPAASTPNTSFASQITFDILHTIINKKELLSKGPPTFKRNYPYSASRGQSLTSLAASQSLQRPSTWQSLPPSSWRMPFLSAASLIQPGAAFQFSANPTDLQLPEDLPRCLESKDNVTDPTLHY